MGILCPACGSDNTVKAGREAGKQRVFCRSCRRRMAVGEKITMKPEAQLTSGGTVSLDKVRSRYDTVALIVREIQAIPAGELMPERELCRRSVGTDACRFRRTVENNMDRFREHRVKLKLDEGEPKWFYGQTQDVKAAEAMRDE